MQNISEKLKPEKAEHMYIHAGTEAIQFMYIQIPRLLILDPVFHDLSDSAKILYSCLLDRNKLSLENGWKDENNRIYIYYTIENVQKDLNVGNTKAKSLFKELINFGLIEKVRQLNKPSRIYVLNFMSVYEDLKKKSLQESDENIEKTTENMDGRKCDPPTVVNATHRQSQMRPTDSRKCDPPTVVNATTNNNNINNNNMNNNSMNNIIPSFIPEKQEKDRIGSNEPDQQKIDGKKETNNPKKVPLIEKRKNILKELQRQIDYDYLSKCHSWDEMELIDVMLNYMTDVIACNETIRIGNSEYDADYLAYKFQQLDYQDIEYAMKCINSNTTEIRDIRRYYIKTLITVHNNYQAAINSEVRHDMVMHPVDFGSDEKNENFMDMLNQLHQSKGEQ